MTEKTKEETIENIKEEKINIEEDTENIEIEKKRRQKEEEVKI